ncbi:MAG: hypothetical protein K0R61_116 [Microvirga sp.]|nr:hypothetical protein [Microvirga sp.]
MQGLAGTLDTGLAGVAAHTLAPSPRWLVELEKQSASLVYLLEVDAVSLTLATGGFSGTNFYSIPEALGAVAAGNDEYFDSQLAVRSTGVAGPILPAPLPPRARTGWYGTPVLSDLTTSDSGLLAKNVITPARYPSLHDAEFLDTQNRASIASAPDGSPLCLRYTYTSGVATQDVNFTLNTFGSPGLHAVGLSCRVWWASTFDWGNPSTALTGGKLGVGLIIGDRDLSTGGTPPELQQGVSIRNSWSNGTATSPDQFDARCRLYSYSFNRREPRLPDGDMEGRNIGPNTGVWPRGQWVHLDYEVKMNTPGVADGIARVWINGTLWAEERDAVYSLDGTYGVRGAMFSDQWGDGVPPATQSVWLKEITYWREGQAPVEEPPAGTGVYATEVYASGVYEGSAVIGTVFEAGVFEAGIFE